MSVSGWRRLHLCGGGPLDQALRALARELRIDDGVDFLGFLPQAEIAQQLSEALCLLLPRMEEQWGLVVNEALISGRAVRH